MKGADLAPWALGGITSFITAAGVWITGSKLRDERRRDREAHEEKLRLAKLEAESNAVAQWKEIAHDREQEINSLRGRLDHLQETVDALRSEMREAIQKRDDLIDMLRGENRQLKQVAESAHRVAANSGEPK